MANSSRHLKINPLLIYLKNNCLLLKLATNVMIFYSLKDKYIFYSVLKSQKQLCWDPEKYFTWLIDVLQVK